MQTFAARWHGCTTRTRIRLFSICVGRDKVTHNRKMMNENMTDANSAVFNTDIDKMNMITLKEELRKRGGRVGGNKQELCQRLRAYMKMGIRVTTDPPTENRPTSIFPSDMNFKDLSISFLPHVKLSHIDLMDYFVFRKSEIDGAPVKNYKSLCDAGYNLFNERFIEIIKCVFESDRVFVLSSVRSQFTKNKQYTVKLILDRCGSGILAASCECVAGVGPKACCKHTAALCYALEYFSKTGLIKCSETPTDVLQTFHQPARKRKVHGSPVKVSNLPIATGSRLCFDPRPVPLRNEEGYESYVKHLMENSGMKLSYLSSLPKPEVNVLSVAHDHFYDTNYLPELVSVSEDSIRDIERKTRGQSRCALWYKERKCRLTASYFGRICHTQDFKTLAHTIIAGSQYQNKFMKWGLDMECLARRRYEEITDHSVSTCGLIIHRTKNYLAASCDGLIGNDRVLELKGVPSHAYDKVSARVAPYLIEDKHGIHLKQSHNYYFQVQGQLFITDRQFCSFAVYTAVDMIIIDIERNEEFIKEMLPQLEKFYFEYFVPALMKN